MTILVYNCRMCYFQTSSQVDVDTHLAKNIDHEITSRYISDSNPTYITGVKSIT